MERAVGKALDPTSQDCILRVSLVQIRIFTAKTQRTQRYYFFICPGKYPGQIKSLLSFQENGFFSARGGLERLCSCWQRDVIYDPIPPMA